MKRLFLPFVFSFFLVLAVHAQQSQNNTCETASPFCTGTTYTFPAGVNAGTGQSGPCYNCLLTRPNPAWYYMKVANPGSIIIHMHSVPSHDIDFCCWGPFPSKDACSQLTCNKVVDCSYSTASSETVDILNAQTGQYYILIITNYSNQPCNIIFQQTGGTGTTDCSILPPPATNNSPICNGQTLRLSAANMTNASYHWWGPNNFVSNVQNPVIPNATTANSGMYYLTVMVNGQPSQDTSTTIAYVYNPMANAGPDVSIPHGTSTQLHGSCTGGSGSYQYHWEPANKLVNPNAQNPHTINLFASTNFTLQITDDSASCTSTDNVMVNIAGTALTVNALATPSSVCKGVSTQLQAMGSGGTGNYTYAWTGPNGFSSNLSSPTVIPTETSTYHIEISDGYNTSNADVVVTVIERPLANAGPDNTIPYGTYTFLNASVVGGSSNYAYEWSPADKLINANVKSPQTANLTETTVYSVIITDMVTNCVSDNPADVTITVSGGPLNVNPVATPASICLGDSTRLHASAGGGNIGFYQYSWISDPPGFTSDFPDPYVKPLQPTTYSLTVYDGYNSISGHTSVSIYPQPAIHLGPADSVVCLYESVTLNAGNPGAGYLWSNGATTQSITLVTTGIIYDEQQLSVTVTNQNGCSSSSSIRIIFNFEACTGISDMEKDKFFLIYPNPTNGMLTIEIKDQKKPLRGMVCNTLGSVLKEFVIKPDKDGHESREIDLSSLPKGLYVIKIINDSIVHTEKLLIE